MCTSVPQMPHAPTSTTSWPCPGDGSGTSVTETLPGVSQTTARIILLSVADPLARGRVEQVQVRGVHPDLDLFSRAGMVAAAADDDVAARVVGQAPVDKGVAAQILDQGDLHGELAAAADRQVLGPDA